MKKLLFFPGAVLCFCLFLTSCSKEDSSNPRILTPETKAALEAAADSIFMLKDAPGMIALFSVEGEDDFMIRRGVGSLVTNEPIGLNNHFRIASNTKPFTGLVTLMLADEGKIFLDSTISHYLPEYDIPNGSLITIRMLGNMTSGLFNYTDDTCMWNALIAGNYNTTFTPAELLEYAFAHPVKFEPGAMYDYCNTNIVLLGLLIEKITGKPAGQVIKEKVLVPLGLHNTYWPNSTFLPAPYTHGYTINFDGLEEATNWNPSWGYTAGALISTVPDLMIWAKAMGEGNLLSENMKAERFNWIENHYGFCIMKTADWVGHAGTMPGYNSHVMYNRVKKITMVLYVNMDTGFPVEYFSASFMKIFG
jgi:D-alanyl-D-alanine carboxypeptidase